MAVNTNITHLANASCITVANNLKIWSRTIDTAVHNLTSGDHFEIFDMPAGTLIVTGMAEILTADSGGGAFTVGIGGTGHEIVNSTNVVSTGKAVIDHPNTMLNSGAADSVDLAAAAANLTTAKIRITLVTLDIDGLTSRGATGAA